MVTLDDDKVRRRRWQQRLLPLMVWMLTGLTVFFFVSSLAQLYVLHQRVEDAPPLGTAELLHKTECPPDWGSEACLTLRRQDTAALLEANVVARRYHQASVVIMASVWSRYLGFVTGMTLALVGAAFILGQIETDASEVGGKGGGWEVSLKSASPGLVLAVLGVLLMIASIVTLHEFDTRDAAVYTGGAGLPSVDLKPPTVPLSRP